MAGSTGIDRDSVVGFDETASGSNLTPLSPAGPSQIEGDRKRKMAVPSKVPAKKPNVSDVRESHQVPKRSWAYLNEGAFTDDGEGKRKTGVSHKVSGRERTKKTCSRSYDLVGDLYSRLTEEDVRRIFETANISFNDYEFLVPSKSQRADTPPQGYISVYEEQINAGLRFPLHDLIVRVCDLIQVSPSQLAPNAYRAIVGFTLCAKFYEIPATEASFSSLFQVMPSKVKGLFTFRPDVGCNFLVDKPSSNGPWKKKFFFMRRKGHSWNCITKWSETFSRPTTDVVLAEAAINKGILNHRFRVNELTRKEILIHGGIEPGVPSPEFTFRFLMHKAAVTKFDLLPEDQPPASASAGKIRTSRLNMNSSTTPLAAHTSPPTLIVSSASLTQPRDEQLVNYQQLQSTPNDNEIPPAETLIFENLLTSSEDSIPPHYPQCKEKNNQESGSRREANSIVLVSNEGEHQPIPPGLLTLWQSIESKYVPKDRYQESEKRVEELSSGQTYTEWRIQELEQELELSEARGVEYENRSSAAHEAMAIQSELIRNRDSELAYNKSRIQALELELKKLEKDHQKVSSELAYAKSRIEELELSGAKRADSDLSNEDMKKMMRRNSIYTKVRIEELQRKLNISTVDFIISSYQATEAMEKLEEMKECVQSRDSELAHAKSRIQELETKLEDSKAKRRELENMNNLTNEL